jgi:hypothetical protein
MFDAELAAAVAQFGTAGLIGWMWLSERRGASERDRQITELHQRIVQERASLDLVVNAVKDNTRALASLEAGQRALLMVFSRLVGPEDARRAAGKEP